MKHNLKVVTILIVMFLIAQYIGLYISNTYTPSINNNYISKELPFGIQKPEFKQETSFISIFLAILIATVFAIVLIKFNAAKLWKVWFFLSVWFALLISFSVFLNQLFPSVVLVEYIALIAAFIITIFKVVKHNIIIHNLSELFIYGGLAAIFAQSLSIFSVSMLLIFISIYDMIAVWQTKHMIKLAKFQTKLKLFAGFLIPYKEKKQIKTAILGGGDIGFPLLFASTVFKIFGFKALIIPLTTTLFLFLLFWYGQKNKFYPAMPFLSIGCFLGYFLVMAI
ncbi:hypothetical protein HYX16_04140 [Candidatus Woesearchaeota archaeon]|nr:hypothetical protein [Candidatus Woesearchaeota archaeon]